VKKDTIRPPRIAERLLGLSLRLDERVQRMGDFDEVYREIAGRSGRFRASLWYWIHVVRSLPSLIFGTSAWGVIMMRNHMTFAWRHLKKNRGFSLINILGFSLSLASIILIMLYIRGESRVDGFNRNLDHIYRLEHGSSCVLPPGFGPFFDGQVPEIRKIARFDLYESEKILARWGEQNSSIRNLVFADPEVFDIFSIEFLRGSPETSFRDLSSIILTASQARAVFGSQDPVGETLLLDNQYTATVTGVIRDLDTFHIPIGALAPYDILGEFSAGFLTRMEGYQSPTYILLQPGSDVRLVEKKLERVFSTRVKTTDRSPFQLRPLNGLYLGLGAPLGDDYRKHGNIQTVRIFILVSVIILLIAVVNYFNLTTARASCRAKEIGMKKVIGASRRHLVIQFLSESVLFSLGAVALGVALAGLLGPVFRRILSAPFALTADVRTLPGILMIVGSGIVLGLLSGAYPAFYLASFDPVRILKGQATAGRRGASFRKLLIVFQFSVSVLLIIATITVRKQVKFMKETELGLRKEQVLILDLNQALKAKKETFKREVQKNPRITNVTFSCRVPGESMWTWETKSGEQEKTVWVNAVDPDFIPAYDIALAAGRNFSWDMQTDRDNAIIANEAAVRLFGLDSPVGRELENMPNGDGRGRIIGVVKDFHFKSLHSPIGPTLLYWRDGPHNKASLRIAPGTGSREGSGFGRVMGHIEDCWKAVCPDYPFDFVFLDDSFDRQYRSEESFNGMLAGFTLFAVLIGCLGLAGLAVHAADQRTKEIGIRMTLGASVGEIVRLLGREFGVLMIISCAVAVPAGAILMNRWLADFAYRTGVGGWTFAAACGFVLAVSLGTVGFLAAKKALSNPADALRRE